MSAQPQPTIIPFPRETPMRRHVCPACEGQGTLPMREDDVSFLPEGIHASMAACEGMQRDRDYCEAMRIGNLLDTVIDRIEARRLVWRLREAGLRLRVEGRTLWVGPQSKVTDELRQEIQASKAQITMELREDIAP